ncbi:MAG TPA: zf-TFIIB domain-containing protein [Planctomycetota bacterium]|nr:zf-TFIIB domain-containing protein [Planctomycetota bacterium]
MPRVLQCCPGCARQYDVGALEHGSAVRCSCGVGFSVTPPRSLAPRALCCARCGGNLRDAARVCDYCQAEVTLEERKLDAICPACFGRMASDARFCMSCGVRIEAQPLAPLPASANCPRCASPLRSRRVGPESLVECASCAGLWVDPELLQRLCADAGARKSIAEALGALPARSVGESAALVRYLPCPSCRQLMNRRNFGSISGIIIDVCKPHGIWLDHGELARALSFAEKGGLVEARRREVAELEQRNERAQANAPSSGPVWFDTEKRAPPGPVGGVLGWLVDELLF